MAPTLSVLLLEPTGFVGGMAGPGGIGLRDHHGDYNIAGTALEWGKLNAAHYNVSYPVWQPDAAVGNASFWKLLDARPKLRVVLGQRLVEGPVSVRKNADGSRISAVTTARPDGATGTPVTWTGLYFIDASYTGDLMHFSGVSSTFGREPRDQCVGGVSARLHVFPRAA